MESGCVGYSIDMGRAHKQDRGINSDVVSRMVASAEPRDAALIATMWQTAATLIELHDLTTRDVKKGEISFPRGAIPLGSWGRHIGAYVRGANLSDGLLFPLAANQASFDRQVQRIVTRIATQCGYGAAVSPRMIRRQRITDLAALLTNPRDLAAAIGIGAPLPLAEYYPPTNWSRVRKAFLAE